MMVEIITILNDKYVIEISRIEESNNEICFICKNGVNILSFFPECIKSLRFLKKVA